MTQQKVAVVTGSGQGIGRAIALRLADDGFQVVISDISMDHANEVVKKIEVKGKKSIAIKADVSKKEEIDRLVQQTAEGFGSLDVFVNNAGIDQVASLMNVTEQDLNTIFSINVFGTLYGIQAAAKQMKKKSMEKLSMQVV